MGDCKIDLKKFEERLGVKVIEFDKENIYYKQKGFYSIISMSLEDACEVSKLKLEEVE